MSRPKKVSVLGHVYDIKWPKTVSGEVPDSKDAYGLSDHAVLRIEVCCSLAPQQQRSTLMHEILHCLFFQMGLGYDWPKSFDHNDKEEDLVNRLAAPMALALSQNRQVFAWISGED